MAFVISSVQGFNNATPWVDAAPPYILFKNTSKETSYLSTEEFNPLYGNYGMAVLPGEQIRLDLEEDTRVYVTNSRLDFAYYEQDL